MTSWPSSAVGIRDRFPAFIAALPMNNVEASLAEIDRAVKTLGARGVQVFTNVAGKPLSAPEFRPIFARMAAHDLPVWVHPMRGPNFPDYAERAGVGERDLVQLRLALRDHRLHDPADLLRNLRRVAELEDHHPPHGRHDTCISPARSVSASGRFSSARPSATRRRKKRG